MNKIRGHQHSPGCYRKSCRGVGLLEVLVAMVVVSFGVLGLAGMQLTGMKHSAGGYNRSKAVLYAENMVTRMRLNPSAVIGKEYDGFDSNTFNSCATKPATYCQVHPASATTTTAAAACTATQMATFDKFSIVCGNWSASESKGVNGLVAELPNGRIQIICDDGASCDADSYYTISVTWSEDSGVDDDETTTDAKRVQVRFNP
ncbi:MAG: type IV pilus modification protein PilV [Granulosicoccus sp.]|nr:type IV pilus modification protein PilV [Granulosicoccus sp.]